MKRLKLSKETCIGCQLCVQACSALYEDEYSLSNLQEGEYSLSKSRIGIEPYYDNNKSLKIKDAYCILCGICENKCPEDAITMSDRLGLDEDACTGCGICANVCPKKAIKMLDDMPLLCDTCDGDPACVAACPHGALKYQ